MSTIERSLKGTLVGTVAFVIQSLQSIIVVPLMLQGWGAEQYAVWLACQASFSLIITLSLGHQNYVGNELGKLLHVDRERTRGLLGSSLRFTPVLACTEVLAVCVVVAFDRSNILLGINSAIAAEWSLGAALLVMLVGWEIAGPAAGILARLYPPMGRYSRAIWWGVGQRGVIAMTAAMAALWQQSILSVALWTGLATVAFNLAILLDASRCFGDLKPFVERGSFRRGLYAFGRSLPLTASTLSAQLQTSGLTLLVSASLGTSAVATVATLRTLANMLIQAATPIFAPAAPELVRFQVRDEHSKVRHGLFGLAVLTSFAATLGVFVLVMAAEPLYQMWTRGKIPFHRGFLHLTGAAVVWRIFGIGMVNHLTVMNDTRWILYWSAAQTATILSMTFLLSSVLGVVGVGSALLVGEVVGSCLIPVLWLRQRLSPPHRFPFVKDQALAALAPVLSTMVLIASLDRTEPERLLVLGGGTALATVLFRYQLRRIPGDLRRQALEVLTRRISSMRDSR